MKKYLKGLKENREVKVAEIIKNGMRVKGLDPTIFSPKLFREVALIQNRTRGSAFMVRLSLR